MKSCPTCRTTYSDHVNACPQDGAALQKASEWLPGATVRGRYIILGKIGRGSLGNVYQARDLRLDELRALKVVHPELVEGPVFRKRFAQEATVLRRLRHPNAARVEATELSEDGRPFLVMEYAEGRSLNRAIHDSAPLGALRVCSIARQVAAALDASHRLGLLHLELKPANILLRRAPEGERVKVLNFGMARIKETCLRGHRSGNRTARLRDLVTGPPEYLSPEQATGKRSDELDGRSDLYSLGVMTYEMLTGRLPYPLSSAPSADKPIRKHDASEGSLGGRSPGEAIHERVRHTPDFTASAEDGILELLLAHLERPPLAFAATGVQVPELLAELVMRLLEKRRELRPPTARALVEEIERVERALTGREAPATGRRRPAASPLAERQPPVSSAATVEPPTAGSVFGNERVAATPFAPGLGPIQHGPSNQPPAEPPLTDPAAVGIPYGGLRESHAADSEGSVAATTAGLGEIAPVPVSPAGLEPAPLDWLVSPPPTVTEEPLTGSPASPPSSVVPISEVALEPGAPQSSMPSAPAEPGKASPWRRVMMATLAVALAAGAVWCFTVYRRGLIDKAQQVIRITMSRQKPPNTATPEASTVPSAPSAGPGEQAAGNSPAASMGAAKSPASSDLAKDRSSAAGPAGQPGASRTAAKRMANAARPHAAPSPSGGASKAPGRKQAFATTQAAQTASLTKTAVDPAEVKRALELGDGFFELGQYDLAIQAYSGPLKIDSTNAALKRRIERAKKAKAAEEKYLNQ